MKLEGSSALVTGAGRGIGRAVALALAREGVSVTGVARSADELESLTAAIRAAGGRGHAVTADLTAADAATRVVDAAVAAHGGLQILVNNAGVGGHSPIAETTDDLWEQIIGTNLTAVFRTTRAALPHLTRSGGHVFMVSSLAGTNAIAGMGAYCASKAALDHLSACLMLEVRHQGVKVTTIAPGSVDTGFGKGSGGARGVDWMLQADDIAAVVVDLLRARDAAHSSRVEMRPLQPPGAVISPLEIGRKVLGAVRYSGRIAWRAFNRFQDHNGPDHAASISYYTLLSLLPLLIFMISLGVLFLGSYDEAFRGSLLLVRGVVIPLDPDSIDVLHDFVENATRFQWPGLLLLAWTSRRIFASLITALEKVFSVPSRNFAKHNLAAVAMVLIMGVIMLLTMALTMVMATSEGLMDRFRVSQAIQTYWMILVTRVVPAVATFGFFFLMYRMVPRRVVPTYYAAIGALLATVLWDLAQKGFAYYVRNLARYAGVYGAFEGVIVLALWLEISASIILYCGEIVVLIAGPRRQQRRIAFEPPAPAA